jgi:hypothetical protein
MDHPVPYQIERKRGYPAFLVGANADEDFVAITHAGRAARIHAENLSLRDNRLISVPMKSNIVGMLSGKAEDEIVIATQSGYAKRINIGAIPYVEDMNSTGEKIMQRANPVIAMRYKPNHPLWALTNQRILPIDADAIPLDNEDKTEHLILKTKRGEKLLTLFTLP